MNLSHDRRTDDIDYCRVAVATYPDGSIDLAAFGTDGAAIRVPLNPDRALALSRQLAEAASVANWRG